MFRQGRHYRQAIFEAGLKRLGYQVSMNQPARKPSKGDVLILWNRLLRHEQIAARYERCGAKVVVVENGYIGREFFAMARTHHNGAGQWKEGGPDRWDSMGIELKPWRTDGSFILVLIQRGIGAVGVAQPRRWEKDIVRRLSRLTGRPIVLRKHPGQDKPEPYEALDGAWAAVTWGSGAAIKALAFGVPVFHELRNWIGAPAAKRLDKVRTLDDPFTGDRLPMFRRLAWAQWRASEVESGEAFQWLLT